MWIPEASADTTVKQTPLTATESPDASSGDKQVVRRRRNPDGVGLTSATSPSVSISPVNIVRCQPLDQHVRAKPERPAIP